LQDTFKGLDLTGVICFPEWRPIIIESLYAYMNERNTGDRQGRKKEHTLLILDDVGLQGKKGLLSEQLDKICFTSRHYGVSVIELGQRISLFTTSFRSQADALLMFREDNPNERINIFKSFGFCEKKQFFNIIDRETEQKYSFIGIRNDGGHLKFFDLDGEITTSRSGLQSRTNHSRSDSITNDQKHTTNI
jgi:hypothetical protein